MFELRVLGTLELRAGLPGGSGEELTQRKRLALLVYLALAEPHGLHSRDRLGALLWPEASDSSFRHSLRNALHALRKALGDDVIVSRGEGYVGLDFSRVQCDALQLREHLAAGRLDEAMALWKGDLAPGLYVPGAIEFEHWLDEQRRELKRQLGAAAWKRADQQDGTGQAEIEALRVACRVDPGNEPGTRRLMRRLGAAGDLAGAHAAYEALAAWFARELEMEPSLETRTLEAELRAAAPLPAIEPPIVPAASIATGSASPPVATRLPSRWRYWGAVAAALAIVLVGARTVSSRPPAEPTARSDAERAALRLPAKYRANQVAYASYLRGLTLRFQFQFRPSRDTLAALVDREPLYVPGLAGLAHAYVFNALNGLTDPTVAWPRVETLAGRAIALDSTSAGAWLALAAEDMYWKLDLDSASVRISRARAFDSLDPDGAGIRSAWYRFRGEMDSAVAWAQRARTLDPLSPLFGRLVAKQLFYARRYHESEALYAQLLRDDPAWKRGYIDMAELYRVTGKPRDAVGWLRKARLAAGDSAGARALGDAATDSAARQLLAADARRTITRLDQAAAAGEAADAASYASAWAIVRDTTATLHWLDQMIETHDAGLNQVRVDPRFDFLRNDPRYAEWEASSGLPPISH